LSHKVRVLLTKIGMDGHDRGVRIVATALREAGMEVIYTGPWQTIEQVTKAAIQEDVDLIGISSLSYDHVLVPRLMDGLRSHRAEDIKVIVGGIIPDDDVKILEEAGVAKIFHPGTKMSDITGFIKEICNPREANKGADKGVVSNGPKRKTN
jgi:methylmalonyl-CoA mutase, C-terminal domain